MIKATRPLINAMLICDRVITEAGTNKKSLIGIFGNINAYKFPCVHPFLAVYIKFTDAKGPYDFRLELVDLESGKVVGEGCIPDPIKIENPLETHDIVFNLAALRFAHPGKYEFRIYANEEICGQKSFFVNKMAGKGQSVSGES
ncbi:MAG: hypothetical protein PHH49_03805 [Candidatus Omnitrophica bacterium]|nr:hypothetical protein [Candidatus Omnitrophota bacterium]MDD5488074.1 hypothetical protein [Candidatus Omnitrophota bacterium]